MTYPLEIKQGHRRATLRKAHVPHRCSHCLEHIYPKTHYYEVKVVGSGLAGKLRLRRTHSECVWDFLARLEQREQEVREIGIRIESYWMHQSDGAH